MLASHQPIAIEDQAVSKLIRNELYQIMLELNQSDEQERKKAARAHVSRNAIGGLNCIYWYSSEAINLFIPTSEQDTNIYKVLVERVALLGAAIQSLEIQLSPFFRTYHSSCIFLREFFCAHFLKLNFSIFSFQNATRYKQETQLDVLQYSLNIKYTVETGSSHLKVNIFSIQ